MEDKRLDLDAPLLSVRRFSATAAAPTAPPSEGSGSDGAGGKPAPPRRTSLPFYKSDLKTGPVGKPGIVPFLWEQTPGRPKPGPPAVSVRTRPKPPPGRIVDAPKLETDEQPGEGEVEVVETVPSGKDVVRAEEVTPVPVETGGDEDGEEDAFTDALDTLSRTESFFVNCSVSGLSDCGGSGGDGGATWRSTDPLARDFMIGRFLPAAQAMATSSPQCASRKTAPPARESSRMDGRAENGGIQRLLPLPYQSTYALRYPHEGREQSASYEVEDDEDEDDEEDDYDGGAHLSTKACGLLPKFCLKSNFLLLNPVPGMKVHGRLPPARGRSVNSAQIKSSRLGSVGHAEEEYSWEAVYRHKLGQGNKIQRESESKITSESNQLTTWSDSPNGSSPCQRSGGSGISPYRNEAPQSPFHEVKGFLGVPERERKGSKDNSLRSSDKDVEDCWETPPPDGSVKGSGSMSPAMEKTLYVDSVCMRESPHSKSSSFCTTTDTHGFVNSTTLEIAETLFPIGLEKPNGVDMDGSKDLKGNGSVDVPLFFDANDNVKNDASPMASLFPPPLPKSPSESWLLRTLPSVSLKNPSPKSLLGIQVQPKKQTLRGSCTDLKPETKVKSYTDLKPETKVKSVKQNRQIRFAEAPMKPLSPQSEI